MSDKSDKEGKMLKPGDKVKIRTFVVYEQEVEVPGIPGIPVDQFKSVNPHEAVIARELDEWNEIDEYDIIAISVEIV